MKIRSLLFALAVAALFPVAAYADEASPSDKANGARSCQALKSSLGDATFKATYGTNADRSNAFGKCVSKWTQAEHQNRHEATAACKADEATAKGAALARCIRAARSAESAEDKAAVVNAARTCKGERKSMGDAAFGAKYGTTADKSNAFGRCVSKLAAAKEG